MDTVERPPTVLKVIAWTVALVFCGAVVILFWAYIGVMAAVLIPLLIIGSVVRSATRDLRGKRYDSPFVVGRVGLSHITKKPKKIRHFSTPTEPPDD